MADQDLTEAGITQAEARIRELKAIIDAGQQATDERASLVRALRNTNPQRYTQERLAALADVSQQAVSTMLDKRRIKWHLAGGGSSHQITITGPTLEEAVLSNRRSLAGIQGVTWDGGNIVSVRSETNPEIASYHNIEVDLEITTKDGNQIIHLLAASDTRHHEMRAKENQAYAALFPAAQPKGQA